MYMLRDPTGPESIQNPTTRWNRYDKISWTENYKFQVPYGIDPTDINQAK